MEIELLIVIFTAVVIDLSWGELPVSIHPVVWMGKFIEKIRNLLISNGQNNNRFSGFIMTLIILVTFNLLFIFILYIFSSNYILYLVVASISLSTTFAIKSLIQSVLEVYSSLNNDLNMGRIAVSYLVSRQTSELSSEGVVSAAIETLTENITDSVISPLFYIFLFGSIGALLIGTTGEVVVYPLLKFIGLGGIGYSKIQFPIILGLMAGVSYRVVNTLDAMVGYKDPQNIDIGWFPACLDDILNYIPSRGTGILIVFAALLMGWDYKSSWQVMLKDAGKTPSPNSGYPMAAAAGALGVQLIKPNVYVLGNSKFKLTPKMIKKAVKLTKITLALFLTLIFAIILLVILL
jgi:adenosylcobinamide-phosphate synthase